MKQKKSFTRTVRIWVALLIAGAAVSIILVDILVSYKDFETESEHTRANYIASQKKMIKD